MDNWDQLRGVLVVHPFGMWEDPADDGDVREWVRAVGAGLNPWTGTKVWTG